MILQSPGYDYPDPSICEVGGGGRGGANEGDTACSLREQKTNTHNNMLMPFDSFVSPE